MLATLFSFISKPIADIVGGYQARKTIAVKSASLIAQAKVDLKVTRIKAKIEQAVITSQQDNDYDTQVLKNRNNTLADEFIILVWFGLFIAHFIPDYAVIMSAGWAAMGYGGVPWWFEFGMVGILVSTLGLMRLFKLWVGKPNKEAGKSNVDRQL